MASLGSASARGDDWNGRVGAIAALCVIALSVAAPIFLSGYRLFEITTIIVDSIALLGLNILMGYNGQISIGHSAFFALGAYTVAILTVRLGLPYWVAVPAAGAVSLAAGLLFGLPALRLGGSHLALATFALAVATPQLLNYDRIEGWTGGTLGMSLNKPEVPFGLPLSRDQWLYYLCLAVAAAMFWLGRNLVAGRIGRAMTAVRDQPIAAAAMGVDNALIKTRTFGVSAMYTGLAGALGAIVAQYVAPDSFTFLLSISFVVGIVIGGAGTISGAIYGAIFIGLVPDFTTDISKAAPWALYGACLIACVYLMPSGIDGALRGLRGRLLPAPERRRQG